MQKLVLIVGVSLMSSGIALGQVANVTSPADTHHPNIHSKVGGGQDGPRWNASPNNSNPRSGGLHGIANISGRSGSRPNDDGVRGQANELETIHGGIGGVDKNAR